MRKLDLVVTGCVFNKEGQLLLCLHKKLKMWLPIGGHIEKNETPDDALLREIFEETGLKVRILGGANIFSGGNIVKELATPFHVNVHNVGDHDHCSFFYVCEALDEEKLKANQAEVEDLKWFSMEELTQEKIKPEIRNLAFRTHGIWRAESLYI